MYYACGILEFGDEFLKGGENVTTKKRREKKKKRFVGPAMGKPGPTILHITRLFYFCIFQKNFYRNIFLVLGFTVLYPYRPAGGRQGAYRPADGR